MVQVVWPSSRDYSTRFILGSPPASRGELRPTVRVLAVCLVLLPIGFLPLELWRRSASFLTLYLPNPAS